MKAIDELKQEFKRTAKLLEAVTEKYLELSEKMKELSKPERIAVPKSILFERGIASTELCLISPDRKCSLSSLPEHGGVPWLTFAGYEQDPLVDLYKGDLFLEPCDTEDLEQGDIIFIGDIDYAIEMLGGYAVVLNRDQQARFVTTPIGYIVTVEELETDNEIYKVVKE